MTVRSAYRFGDRVVKRLKNIAVVLLFILLVDGCVHRDPHITLRHGYEIVSNSHSSPCSLQYVPSHDKRPYSDFKAISSLDTETNKAFYDLVSETEVLNFKDEESWREAIVQHRAGPAYIAPQLEDVSLYAANATHVIGSYEHGFFILEYATNYAKSYETEAEWRAGVADSTELVPSRITDPTAFFAQTRDPIILAFYAVLICVAVCLPAAR